MTVGARALNSRLQFWMTDDARSRAEAEARLASCLEGLRREGIAAEGLIIATHPEGRSNWLERGVPDLVRAAYPDRPVQHVVVDAPGVAGAKGGPGKTLGSTA